MTFDINDRVLSIARGDYPADLVLKNCKIIDVFTGSVYKGNIAITDGYIVGTGDYSGTKEIDLGGKYVAPGFIDAHIHIESSMVTPREFANAVLPRGTTTVIADPHELANVYGMSAIEYFLNADEQILLDIYIMLPSCVPATDLETSGAVLSHKELQKFITHSKVLGLGEMMNYPGVIFGDPQVWDKINLFRNKNLLIDGHIQSIEGKPLCAYCLPGIRTNHEATMPEEAINYLRMGMKLLIREGSAAKNLKDLIKVVNKNTLPHCMLATDDRHPTDIIKQGHIDHLIRMCIKSGLDPIDAIIMATLNPAKYFGLNEFGAIAPGYQADLVVFDDLEEFTIQKVYKKGIPVGDNGSLVGDKGLFVGENYLSYILPRGLNAKKVTLKDLDLKISQNSDDYCNDGGIEQSIENNESEELLQVIKIIPGQLLTERVFISRQSYLSGQEDIAKLVVVERHKATGNIGVGLVMGFNLKGGAIVSTVAHDSHNIVCVGDNDQDIITAVEAVNKLQGGLAVVKNGQVLASLALPIGGLMTEEPLEKVVEKLEQLEEAAYQLNISKGFNPFMTLSFLSLPVLPQLRLTDKGLVDVDKFKIVPLSVKN